MKDETTITVPGDWYQVDFHVHTPASFDYKVESENESHYIDLLHNSITSNLDVIVITDHNSIDGYRRLLEIKEDFIRTKRTLERNNEQIPEIITTQLSLFEKVVILPGVELDVKPNIHMIAVFNPRYIDAIDDFLDRAGFSKEVRGEETISKYAKWHIEEFYIETEKINAIVFAAHVDSNKGLYEVTKGWGQQRILAFCDDRLHGMEFNNPITRDQIKNIMRSQHYNRKTPLAFIQSSDFHAKQDQVIGEKSTWVRMDKLERQDAHKVFLSIQKALKNPDEFVSAPGRPELNEILKKLDDAPCVENTTNDDEKRKLIRLICATSNTIGGTVVIGRNLKGNWVGQTEKSQLDFEDKISELINTSIKPKPNYSLHVYPYYENIFIATIGISDAMRFCVPVDENQLYLLEKGKPVVAQINEIVSIVEDRLIDRYSHLSITSKLTSLSTRLMGIEDSIDILPIVRKIDINSKQMNFLFGTPETGSFIDSEIMNSIQFEGNGYSEGNVALLSFTKPRYVEHYLRITAPLGIVKTKSNDLFTEMKLFSGEKIIVAPGGGVYYDDNDLFVVCDFYSPLIFTQNQINDSFTIKFLIAYLKSSVAIWYAERCLGTADIRTPICRDLPIPWEIEPIYIEEAEDLIDKIISNEHNFLDNEQILIKNLNEEIFDEEDFKSQSLTLTKSHNLSANAIMRDIDILFYRLLKLTNKEISLIENTLKSAGFSIFS